MNNNNICFICRGCSCKQYKHVAKYRCDQKSYNNQNVRFMGLFRSKPEVLTGKGNSFSFFGSDIVECEACGLKQILNMPSAEDLNTYYTQSYWINRPKTTSYKAYKICPRASAQTEMLFETIPNFSPENVLEIGAGSATPSLLLRDKMSGRARVMLRVVEPSPFWYKYYKKNDIELTASSYPFVTDAHYDHIHASHWLEHVPNPRQAVNAMYAMLSAGGTLFLEVPYNDKEYWCLPLLDSPHTLFFSQDTLSRLVVNCGFKCIKIERSGISLASWANGEWPTDEMYKTRNENGFWIRGIFVKPKCT